MTSSGWRSAGRYTKVSNFNDIQAGDIVVVRGHVGIAAGGGTVIDASSSNGKVPGGEATLSALGVSSKLSCPAPAGADAGGTNCSKFAPGRAQKDISIKGGTFMQTILVCDDDKQIVEAIDIYLTGEGFKVIKTYDGYEALEYLETQSADLLILDVMMPGLDGIRTTLKVRETSSIPIIILSAKSEDADKILGLNIGADDYITKPFNPLELVARVKSQLRRYTQLGNMNQQAEGQVYKCGGLQINDDNKEVTVDGDPIKLTPIEYNILLLLVKNAGKVFSIDEIYEKIWNEEAIGADNTVAVHIRHIREKIEINPREPKYLKVVWGVGYKIEKQ